MTKKEKIKHVEWLIKKAKERIDRYSGGECPNLLKQTIYNLSIYERELKLLIIPPDDRLKIAIIETDDIEEQVDKIESELKEFEKAFILKFDGFEWHITITKKAKLKALDLLIATMNLVHMLKIPQEIDDFTDNLEILFYKSMEEKDETTKNHNN